MYSFYDLKNTDPQQQVDVIFAAPAGKLDADEYSAEDLDGITESLFGSGNLNFLSLQAGQTNEAIALNTSDIQTSSDFSFAQASTNTVGSSSIFKNSSNEENTFEISHNEISTDTDRSLDITDTSSVDLRSADGNFNNTTIGSLGASVLSSDVGGLSSSNLSLSSDSASLFENSVNQTVINQNVTNSVNDTVHNVLNTLNQTFENITNLGNEIVENILEGDISEVVNNVTNQVLEITDVVNNTLQDLGVTEVIDNVTNLIDDTISNVTNGLGDILCDSKIVLDLDVNVLETLGVNIGLEIDDGISGQLGTELLSNHAMNMVQDLTNLNLPLVTEIGADIGINLLNGGEGTDNATGDSDLSVIGLNIPDIALDPAESLVGDIDITLNVPDELMDPGSLIEDVHDVINGLDDLDLSNTNDVLDLLNDQDVEGNLGLDIIDHQLDHGLDLDVPDIIDDASSAVDEIIHEDSLIDDVLGIVQNTVENITDNIEPVINDIQDALDALTGGNEGNNEILDSINDIWTEGGNDGGLFDDIINNSDLGGDLPDPIGGITEGLGALDIPNGSQHGGLGGLGGLFH